MTILQNSGTDSECYLDYDGDLYDAHAQFCVPNGSDACESRTDNRCLYEQWRDSTLIRLPHANLLGGLFCECPRSSDTEAADILARRPEVSPLSRYLISVGGESCESSSEGLLEEPIAAGFRIHRDQANGEATAGPEWVWRLAEELGWLISLPLPETQSQQFVDHLRRFRARYSSVRVVLTHITALHGAGIRTIADRYTDFPGLWFASSACTDASILTDVLAGFGPGKLVWSSDRRAPGTDVDPVAALAVAGRSFGFNSSDWEHIFCKNALKLTGQFVENLETQTSLMAARARITPWGTQLFSKRAELHAPHQWPTHYSEARGCKVWDLDGRCYEDFSTNAVGACLLGYRDSDVTAAVTRRLQLGSMTSLNCPEEIELAERLVDIHPWASKVKFARTGGEIAAAAVRLARAVTGKSKVAICGYHGCHDWYLAAALQKDGSLDKHVLPGLDSAGVPRELAGTTVAFRPNDVPGFLEMMDRESADMAAVVMEPCRFELPNREFLSAVRRETAKRNVMLIFDEISIGWRLCFGGAHLQAEIQPDMAIFAKALGNGHPIAALLGTSEAMREAERCFLSSTYWTEGLGPAAALATLDKFQALNIWRVIERTGKRIAGIWTRAAESHGLRIKAPGEGSCYCFAQLQFETEHAIALRTLMTQKMLDRNFLAGGTVYATYAHDDAALHRYETAIEEVFKELADVQDDPTAIMESLRGPVAQTSFQRIN